MSPVTDDWYGCYGASLTGWLVPAAFRHPAKFSRRLIERMYAHAFEQGWLVPGQTVLDPMAGVATGAIPAANAGLRWEGIELERHFVEASQAVIEKHRRVWEALGKPVPILRQGDARQLGGVADCVMSSPPYADSIHAGSGIDPSRLTGAPPGPHSQVFSGGYSEAAPPSAIISSPPYADAINAKGDGIDWTKTGPATGRRRRGPGTKHYETLSAQESYGAIVTSPPFSPDQPTASQSRLLAEGYDAFKSPAKRDATHRGSTPGQVGALPPGAVQAVITSPPYVGGGHHPDQTGSWWELQAEKKIGLGTKQAAGYGPTRGQIGRVPAGQLAAVVTSPPYEQSHEGNRADGQKGIRGKDPEARQKRDYSPMASLSGETYWTAMRQIYGNCFAVLPRGGHILLVVKGFVRHGQYVDLPAQTCQLLEAVGFRVLHRHRAWLVAKEAQGRFDGGEDRRAFKSFFRRIQERRGAPAVDFEEVVCAEKP